MHSFYENDCIICCFRVELTVHRQYSAKLPEHVCKARLIKPAKFQFQVRLIYFSFFLSKDVVFAVRSPVWKAATSEKRGVAVKRQCSPVRLSPL